MAIPIDELNKIDYEIIRYTSKLGSATKTQLEHQFKNISGLDLRLSNLSTYNRRDSHGISFAIPGTAYIEQEHDVVRQENGSTIHIEKEIYRITDLGRMVLQDYDVKRRANSFQFWRRSILTPISVSIATTLLTMLAIRLLQRWL